MALAPRAGLQAKASTSRGPFLPLPTVESRQLANGLNVLVQPDFTAPVVSIQFWCATGSIHEGAWLGAGMSHLLEHLMFKGTPTRGNSQMAQQIQDLGGHLNAYTSFDRTVYHVDLPSDHALPALEILGDSVFNSTLPVEEYDREMEVIRREFAMGRDNPDSELGRLIFQTAFTRHPYRHPVIGYLDLFNQIGRDDVAAYYQARYAPQNLTLIVCGAVEPETIFKHATELLEKYPRRRLADIYIPGEPKQERRRELRQPFATQLSRVAIAFPIGGLSDPDTPALDLLATLARRWPQLAAQPDLRREARARRADRGLRPTRRPATASGASRRVARPKKKSRSSRKSCAICSTLLLGTRRSLEELDRAKRQSLLHQVHSQKDHVRQGGLVGPGLDVPAQSLFQRPLP